MSERKEGWYWVKCHDDDQWQCAEWENGGWWMVGEEMHIGNSMIIGQRIPTPDEPWQCVPKELTQEMCRAVDDRTHSDDWPDLYRAMLSAAPTLR